MTILKKIVGAAPFGPKFRLGLVGPRWAQWKNVTKIFCLENCALSNDMHIDMAFDTYRSFLREMSHWAHLRAHWAFLLGFPGRFLQPDFRTCHEECM